MVWSHRVVTRVTRLKPNEVPVVCPKWELRTQQERGKLMQGLNLFNILLALGALFFLGLGMRWWGKVKKRDMYKSASLIVLVVIFVFGFWMNVIPNPLANLSMPSGGVPSYQPPAAVPPSATACGDDNLGTLYARAEDAGASTLTYFASDVYVTDANGQLTPYSATLGTSSPAWTVINSSLPCGKTYGVVGITSAGTHSSTPEKTVPMNSETEYVEFEGYQLSKASITVKDETDNKRYLAADDDAGSNTTGFVDLNTTLVGGTSSYADIAVGTDGQIDDKIYIKAATANKYFVEPDMPMFICVDTGTDNEWQEPSITFEGTRLSSDGALAKMNDDDLTGSLVSAAEWCFYVPPEVHQGIGDTQKEILFRIKARSGQNPDTSNDDVTISFLGVGKYASSKAPIIEEGIYTDASTQALVVSSSAEVPKIVYQIS